jgi:DHA2 family methylenomycin A resistance protein-like MFS transporter
MAITVADGTHSKQSFLKISDRCLFRANVKSLTILGPDHSPTATDRFTAHTRSRSLFVVCFGFFLVLLDTTALNIATPALGKEYGRGISDLQWVVNSYTLVFASLLLTAGAVGDRVGVKRSYQIGLALFTLTSLLSAISPSLPSLIMVRALQGLGAAIMLPASLALLSHTFPDPAERSRAVTTWANTASLGFAAGPVLGGVLTNWLGWRSIFWVNVPVGIVALYLNHLYTEEAKVDRPRRIDWSGQLAIGLALFALTYGLIEVGRRGWNDAVALGSLACAVFLLCLFFAFERRSDHPVLPGFLFSQPTFATCIGVGFVLNFGMYGILFIESVYLQNARGLGALAAGLTITPFTLLPTIASRLLGQRNGIPYLKPRISLGLALGAIGSGVLVAGALSAALWPIPIGLGLLGISMGIIMPAMTAGVLISSAPETSGLASGLLNSTRQIGGTVGVALLGTTMQTLSAGAGLACALGITILAFLFAAELSRRTLP